MSWLFVGYIKIIWSAWTKISNEIGILFNLFFPRVARKWKTPIFFFAPWMSPSYIVITTVAWFYVAFCRTSEMCITKQNSGQSGARAILHSCPAFCLRGSSLVGPPLVSWLRVSLAPLMLLHYFYKVQHDDQLKTYFNSSFGLALMVLDSWPPMLSWRSYICGDITRSFTQEYCWWWLIVTNDLQYHTAN